MKKIILSVIFITILCFSGYSQRLAFVDSEYILKHVPEYASSQKQLDALSLQWQKEIDTRFQDVEKMYKTYQADQVLLTAEMKKRREDEIIIKEKEAKDLQKQKFGYEGELFQQRLRLIKPIQERVAKAIEEYSSRQDIDIMLDKNSGAVMMLYARPSYDKSNDIITKLGYKPGSFAK